MQCLCGFEGGLNDLAWRGQYSRGLASFWIRVYSRRLVWHWRALYFLWLFQVGPGFDWGFFASGCWLRQRVLWPG